LGIRNWQGYSFEPKLYEGYVDRTGVLLEDMAMAKKVNNAKKKKKNKTLTTEQNTSVGLQNLLGQDSQAATDLANRFFAEGSLGRVNEERPAAVQEYLDKYKAATEGYTAPELQAQREQAQRGIDTQYQTGLAQLAKQQARSGVRGAAAGAASRNMDRARMGEQQNLEQDIFIRNADEKQRRLGEYARSLEGARADELGRRKTNLDQLSGERAGSISTFLNSLNLGMQNKQANRDYQINRQMLNIAKRNARRSGGSPNYNAYAQGLAQANQNIYG
jgi:hypothetical protein